MNPASIAMWLKIAALAVPLTVSTAYASVRLLGLETEEHHDADITRIESAVERNQMLLQCLLWEVPAERCDAAAD